MGHVINPVSYRLYTVRYWNNSWFDNKNYVLILHRDFLIYQYIAKFFSYKEAYFFSHCLIKRVFNSIDIQIFVYDYRDIDVFDSSKRKLKYIFFNKLKLYSYNLILKERRLKNLSDNFDLITKVNLNKSKLKFFINKGLNNSFLLKNYKQLNNLSKNLIYSNLLFSKNYIILKKYFYFKNKLFLENNKLNSFYFNQINFNKNLYKKNKIIKGKKEKTINNKFLLYDFLNSAIIKNRFNTNKLRQFHLFRYVLDSKLEKRNIGLVNYLKRVDFDSDAKLLFFNKILLKNNNRLSNLSLKLKNNVLNKNIFRLYNLDSNLNKSYTFGLTINLKKSHKNRRNTNKVMYVKSGKKLVLNLKKLSLRWTVYNFLLKNNSDIVLRNLSRKSINNNLFKSNLKLKYKLYLKKKFKSARLNKYKVGKIKYKLRKKKKRLKLLNKKYSKYRISFKGNYNNKFKLKKFRKKNKFKKRFKPSYVLKKNKNKLLFFKNSRFKKNYIKKYFFNKFLITVNKHFYKKKKRNKFYYSFLSKNKRRQAFPIKFIKNYNLKFYIGGHHSKDGNKLDNLFLNYFRLYNKKSVYKNKFIKNLPRTHFLTQALLEKKKYNKFKMHIYFRIHRYEKFYNMLSNNFNNNILNTRMVNIGKLIKYKNFLNNIRKSSNFNKKTKNFEKFFAFVKTKKLLNKKKKINLKNSIFILQNLIKIRKNFIINQQLNLKNNTLNLLRLLPLKKLFYLISTIREGFFYKSKGLKILHKSYLYFIFFNLKRVFVMNKNIIKQEEIIKLKINFYKKLNIENILMRFRNKYSSYLFILFYKVFYLKYNKINIYNKNYNFFNRSKKKELFILYNELNKLEKQLNLSFNIIREPSASMFTYYIKNNLKKRSTLNQIIYPVLRSLLYIYKNIIGIQINVSGRFTKKSRKSYLWYHKGKVAVSTPVAFVDYAKDFVILRFGLGGIKVWIYYRKLPKTILHSKI